MVQLCPRVANHTSNFERGAKMRCPLFHSEFMRMRAPELPQGDTCLKKGCAWWIPAFEVCAVMEIAIRLGQNADEMFNANEIYRELIAMSKGKGNKMKEVTR